MDRFEESSNLRDFAKPPVLIMSETNESAAAPTVHVVDDEPSICKVFEKVGTMIGVHTRSYATAESFLSEYDPDKPGCLILDIHLPTMSGLELLEEMSNRNWSIPIVIMSGKAAVSQAIAAFRAGSIDFLEKPFGAKEIEAAIRQALEVDRKNRMQRAQSREEQAALSEIHGRFEKLTPRERQVMGLVVAGKPNRIIAEELGVSPKTIEVHRANVMQKMQAGSLPELVKMAIAHKGSEERAES